MAPITAPSPEEPLAMDASEPLLARIKAEYREMPGLSLTAAQASRLLGIEGPLCERLLDNLVGAGALRSTVRGVYVGGQS